MTDLSELRFLPPRPTPAATCLGNRRPRCFSTPPRPLTKRATAPFPAWVFVGAASIFTVPIARNARPASLFAWWLWTFVRTGAIAGCLSAMLISPFARSRRGPATNTIGSTRVIYPRDIATGICIPQRASSSKAFSSAAGPSPGAWSCAWVRAFSGRRSLTASTTGWLRSTPTSIRKKTTEVSAPSPF